MKLPLRRYLFALILAALGMLLAGSRAHAQAATPASGPPAAPILRIETGMHTASIKGIAVDAAGRYMVTASDDKTARVWDARTGTLLSVLRPPIGDGPEGFLYAAALSPDGATVALGGFTGYAWDKTCCIYLFERASGRMVRRLTGLPDTINRLAFSPDGRRLAAALHSDGIRVWDTATWLVVGQDTDYGDQSYGIAFSPDSARLAASCIDGFVRLYAVAADGSLTLIAKSAVAGGKQPCGIAFSPDGTRLAVGFNDAPRVAVVSAADLSLLFTPDATGLDNGNLVSVAWSADGETLYAGGTYGQVISPIFIWADAGKGQAMVFLGKASAIFDLQPRPGGGVFFGAGDPAFGALDAAGKQIFFVTPAIADYRDNRDGFNVSADGGTVQFRYQEGGKQPATFALAARAVTPGPGDAGLAAPVTQAEGLDVEGWRTTTPTLSGQALKLEPFEPAESLAIAPDKQSFLLGAAWHFYCFHRDGTQAWSVVAPGETWAVNVSGDGKLAVAAFADGTIRWYRMSDGKELLDFFPDADQKRWVAWTPSGYYDCSSGGEDLIGWHVNRGPDQAADFFSASQFRDTFYRPDVVARLLTTLDEGEAVKEADAAAGHASPAPNVLADQPPVVSLLSPQEGAAVGDATVTLQYTVRTPSGAPVTEVRALVDGRPVQVQSGLSVVSPDGVIRTLQIPIPPRDCLVSVLAFNDKSASEPASAHIYWQGAKKGMTADDPTPPSPEFTIQPTLYVLAVGISKYADTDLTLTYPDKDAGDFVTALRAQKGRLYKDVVVYNGGALTDGAATKDAIEDGLDWIQKQSTSNDVAMVFLSGHGNNDADCKYYYLPANFDPTHVKSTGLPWTDIQSTMQDITGKVILFNDSCHSGNINGGTLKGMIDNTGIINELTSAENGSLVFSAATGSEFALENAAWGNGAFTKALVEGLDGQADDHHTGRITVNMLSLYVSERVKTLTKGAQHPTMEKPSTVRDFPLATDP